MARPEQDKQDKNAPPAADPRAGRNPGYAENQPRDRGDVRIPVEAPRPNTDEPGIDRDTDEQADPAKK